MSETELRREAISWWVCMQSGAATEQQRAELEAWLRADAGHRQAWERVRAVERGIRQVPPALAHAAFAPVRRRTVLRGLVGLGFGALAGWGVYRHAPWQHLVADFGSPVGQTRHVALGAGASLILASDTALRVRPQGGGHAVHLLRGEVLADVRSAPLWLDTGFGLLHTEQARFCAARGERGCRVELLEGGLAVDHGEQQQRLSAPQGVRLGRAGGLRLQAVDADAAAWVDGLVVAQEWSLDRLVYRLSRARHGVILVDDRIAGLRVSGVFPLYDAERALAAAARSLPIQVERRSRFWLSVVPA
ncbi:DUF4880 domain-containing protein [Bordetella trematum]|uniref:DUF4880 domain-containing protein n=1 Tax=Bordetella trematum TaxID=123899 RepID=UPI000D9F75FE|nr:DUF4880 domain-containing protein [Bordetella trematum]SPU49985.1 transmembrane sensor protein [Bordetella trematum]VDH07725.1 fec operon regulator FecR [Bordetella trematum]